VSASGEDGYGNDVPMETIERFPQELGNLAQNARFPHSHSPIPLGLEGEREERRATEDPPISFVSVARPWWPVLNVDLVAGFAVSTEGYGDGHKSSPAGACCDDRH
jgi:hypothetical protein